MINDKLLSSNITKPLIKIILTSSLLLSAFIFLINLLNLSSILLEGQYKSLGLTLLLAIQNICFLLPIYLFAPRNEAKQIDLGFNKVSLRKIVGYSIIGFLFFFGTSILILNLQAILNIQIPGFGEQDARLPLFGDGQLNRTIAFIAIVIIAPILEEVIFRGYLFQNILKLMPALPAIILSGLIFAIAHAELQVILPLWLLGIITCWLFYKTKSIYTPLFFHIANNCLAFIVESYLG